MCQSLNCLCCPQTGTSLSALYWGAQNRGQHSQGGLTSAEHGAVWGRLASPSAGTALPNAAHGYQWPPLPQGAQQDNPQALFCRACTCYSFSSSGLCISLRRQSRCPSAHVSSLLPSLRAAAQPRGLSATPLHFVSSANPLWVRLVPSSRSLMEMLKSTGPNTDPKDTPPGTDL